MAVTITTTAGPVLLKERWENYRAGTNRSGPYINKEYAYEDPVHAFQVVHALTGTTTSYGSIGGPLERVPAHNCPEAPLLICLSAEITGIGEVVNDGAPNYQVAIIACSYGLPPYDEYSGSSNDADPAGDNSFPGGPYAYAEQSIGYSTEVIKLPGSAYKFDSDGLPVDFPVPRIVSTATMTYTRKAVPYLPTKLILSLMNTLNDATFFGAPRGQVMFTDARTQRYALSDGTVAQDLEYVFKYRESDFNNQLHPKTGAWDPIINVNDASKPYPYKDLSQLLK